MSTNAQGRDPETLLRGALDAARIGYEMQRTEAGLSYAAFGYESPGGGQLPFTAFVRGGALRLTLHNLLPGPAYANDLWLFNEVNQDWAFARVYFHEAANAYEAATGLYYGDEPPRPEALRFTIEHLAEAAANLRGYGTPQFLAPNPDQPVGTEDLAALLREAGLPFYASADGRVLTVRFTEDNGHEFYVELFVPRHDHMIVRAHHGQQRTAPEDETTLREMQSLNRLTGAGAVCFWRGAGRMYYQFALPFVWNRLDRALLGWLVDQCGMAMVKIDEYLKSRASHAT